MVSTLAVGLSNISSVPLWSLSVLAGVVSSITLIKGGAGDGMALCLAELSSSNAPDSVLV